MILFKNKNIHHWSKKLLLLLRSIGPLAVIPFVAPVAGPCLCHEMDFLPARRTECHFDNRTHSWLPWLDGVPDLQLKIWRFTRLLRRNPMFGYITAGFFCSPEYLYLKIDLCYTYGWYRRVHLPLLKFTKYELPSLRSSDVNCSIPETRTLSDCSELQCANSVLRIRNFFWPETPSLPERITPADP